MFRIVDNPATLTRSCLFCSRFVRIVSSDTVECAKFGNNFPARVADCAYFEREPGVDDEAGNEFWREVMHRMCPPRPQVPLKPRSRAEVLAIMGPNYRFMDEMAPLP